MKKLNVFGEKCWRRVDRLMRLGPQTSLMKVSELLFGPLAVCGLKTWISYRVSRGI